MDGKKLFAQKECDQCHAVSSAGIAAKTRDAEEQGPDLRRLPRRLDRGSIGRYLKQQANRQGKRHPTSFKGTDEELQTLVDWLLEQKAEG